MTHSQTTLHPIWDEFPAIRKELQGVLDRIEANLDANDADVEAALIDMFAWWQIATPCIHDFDWSFLSSRA